MDIFKAGGIYCCLAIFSLLIYFIPTLINFWRALMGVDNTVKYKYEIEIN